MSAIDTRVLAPDDAGLAAGGSLLRARGLVAFPTETVYGLGADATDAAAVQRVFSAKGRPADNPLIVHVPRAADLAAVARTVTPLARRLADAFWPGPLTLVVDAHPDLPRATTAGLATVAVRVPDHPVAVALLEAAGVPVAAPSANRSGRPSPTTAGHVLADLGGRIDAVVDGGACVIGVESTVVDARGGVPVVLREGAVTRADLGLSETQPAETEPDGVTPDLAASPGTRHRHYRPSCRVELADPEDVIAVARSLAEAGQRVALVSRQPAPRGALEVARFEDAAGLAALLYGALRDAEEAGVDVIVFETVPEVGVGRAVMDRLRRAAG